MYESYYNLSSKPFTLLPDPEFVYLSERHAMAYAMLEYGIASESGGFIVITGEVGSGKTTLIRKLLKDISSTTTVGLISHTAGDFLELLQWILSAYGIEYKNKTKVEQYHDLLDYINLQHKQGKKSVLIIDEAQNLSIDTLEELRMIANINADNGQKLQLLLSGQPDFLKRIRDPKLYQFSQRVSVQFHIDPLEKDECIDYINHRLSVSGRNTDLFDNSALHMIWYYSRGIPRVINSICDLSLVYGYAQHCELINTEIIRSVIQDRKNGGLFTDIHDKDNINIINKTGSNGCLLKQ